MSAQYFNKNGQSISREQWKKLRADPSYTIIREFENSSIYAKVQWYGEVLSRSTPPEHRKLFKLTVQNIVTHDGNGVPYDTPLRSHDPDASDDFRTEKEAIAVYEDLLVRYADCEWNTSSDGTSHFVDKGNILIPPPPPPPDAPDVASAPAEVVELVGSW